MKKLEKLKSKEVLSKSLKNIYGGLRAYEESLADASTTFYSTHCTDSGHGSSDCEDDTKDKDK